MLTSNTSTTSKNIGNISSSSNEASSSGHNNDLNVNKKLSDDEFLKEFDVLVNSALIRHNLMLPSQNDTAANLSNSLPRYAANCYCGRSSSDSNSSNSTNSGASSSSSSSSGICEESADTSSSSNRSNFRNQEQKINFNHEFIETFKISTGSTISNKSAQNNHHHFFNSDIQNKHKTINSSINCSNRFRNNTISSTPSQGGIQCKKYLEHKANSSNFVRNSTRPQNSSNTKRINSLNLSANQNNSSFTRKNTSLNIDINKSTKSNSVNNENIITNKSRNRSRETASAKTSGATYVLKDKLNSNYTDLMNESPKFNRKSRQSPTSTPKLPARNKKVDIVVTKATPSNHQLNNSYKKIPLRPTRSLNEDDTDLDVSDICNALSNSPKHDTKRDNTNKNNSFNKINTKNSKLPYSNTSSSSSSSSSASPCSSTSVSYRNNNNNNSNRSSSSSCKISTDEQSSSRKTNSKKSNSTAANETLTALCTALFSNQKLMKNVPTFLIELLIMMLIKNNFKSKSSPGLTNPRHYRSLFTSYYFNKNMRGTSNDLTKIFRSNKSIWLPWQAMLLPGSARSARSSKSPTKARTKSAKSISPCKSKIENKKLNNNSKLYRSVSSLSINSNESMASSMYKIKYSTKNETADDADPFEDLETQSLSIGGPNISIDLNSTSTKIDRDIRYHHHHHFSYLKNSFKPLHMIEIPNIDDPILFIDTLYNQLLANNGCSASILDDIQSFDSNSESSDNSYRKSAKNALDAWHKCLEEHQNQKDSDANRSCVSQSSIHSWLESRDNKSTPELSTASNKLYKNEDEDNDYEGEEEEEDTQSNNFYCNNDFSFIDLYSNRTNLSSATANTTQNKYSLNKNLFDWNYDEEDSNLTKLRFNLNDDKSTSDANRSSLDNTHNDKILECDCSSCVNKEGLSRDFSEDDLQIKRSPSYALLSTRSPSVPPKRPSQLDLNKSISLPINRATANSTASTSSTQCSIKDMKFPSISNFLASTAVASMGIKNKVTNNPSPMYTSRFKSCFKTSSSSIYNTTNTTKSFSLFKSASIATLSSNCCSFKSPVNKLPNESFLNGINLNRFSRPKTPLNTKSFNSSNSINKANINSGTNNNDNSNKNMNDNRVQTLFYSFVKSIKFLIMTKNVLILPLLLFILNTKFKQFSNVSTSSVSSTATASIPVSTFATVATSSAAAAASATFNSLLAYYTQ